MKKTKKTKKTLPAGVREKLVDLLVEKDMDPEMMEAWLRGGLCGFEQMSDEELAAGLKEWLVEVSEYDQKTGRTVNDIIGMWRLEPWVLDALRQFYPDEEFEVGK